jgi:superfamily II DNA or RNA helicase
MELTTNLLAELGGWPALKEARGLAERGQVSEARRDGNTIRGRVRGTEKIYDAQIVLADRVSQVEVRCTCPESRRTGRVCAHALAVGLALLNPAPAKTVAPSPVLLAGPRRWSREEAPGGIPVIECTVLLPLQLKDALGQNSLRIILEARREDAKEPMPWEPALRGLENGFAVGEEDARLLDALEKVAGGVAGINSVPRARTAAFLRALSDHPRIWLGKKHRLEVRAATERPKIPLQRRADGALELKPENDAAPLPGIELPLSGWRLDNHLLLETPALPEDFPRLIPRAEIPRFLSRDWPRLERICEIVFPPDFEEFILDTAPPVIEAHLEGALSGLTLNLAARYGDQSFPLGGKGDAVDRTNYFADPDRPNRFWRRDAAAEQSAQAQAEAAGFNPTRSGTSTYSLIQENQVARFLANTLPRWRQGWTVVFGARLESTLREIDIAQPEFSLRSGSGEDWLGLDLKLSVHGKPVPLAPTEIQRWLQTGQNHTRTADRRVLLLPTEAWGEMREVLADCAVEQEPGRMRISRTHAPFLAAALTAQGFHGNSVPPVAPEVKSRLDPELWNQLRPYQARGIEWLAGLAEQNFHGLLADDMGLGKTLQALAFCAWLRAVHPGQGPALVVCPTSLVTNWLREAARFVPHLRALDLTGADRAARWDRAGEHDLLVTSYAILRRDVERYRALDFSLAILDEAQHIKNRGSQNAQAAKAVRARHRLILTGTPLENSLLDLWSLFDFLLPGYLGSAAEFRERYETPLTRGPEPRTMERLRHRVRPFFLRRTKEEVLPDLPPKLEYPTLCELSGEQREVYRAILAQGRRDVFDRAGKTGRDRMAVLTTLLRLRQVCCHLDLLPAGEEKRVWKEPSTKLERTFELIDEAIDGGHRVLLFSQFVRVLRLLRDEAQRREMPYAYLDGKTVERQAEVDRFQQDAGIPLFLISLKAGGTGLNLTGADTVIHFDPWWNPAVEEQATARAHRLGQSRRVQAYKLIAAGTVEEKIQALQSRKRELFRASLGSDEALVESLTGDELEELLAE